MQLLLLTITGAGNLVERLEGWENIEQAGEGAKEGREAYVGADWVQEEQVQQTSSPNSLPRLDPVSWVHMEVDQLLN